MSASSITCLKTEAAAKTAEMRHFIVFPWISRELRSLNTSGSLEVCVAKSALQSASTYRTWSALQLLSLAMSLW
eukprot:s3981_g2.t1